MSLLRRLRILALTLPLAACGTERDQLLVTETEGEANEVLVLLERFEVATAEKEEVAAQRKTAWRVLTHPAEAARARQILDHLGLPRPDRGGLSVVLDGGGVIPSKLSERSRLMHAKAEKLSYTLESHQDVVSARVHIVLPDVPLGGADEEVPEDRRPKASVYVRYLAPSAAASGASPSPEALAAWKDEVREVEELLEDPEFGEKTEGLDPAPIDALRRLLEDGPEARTRPLERYEIVSLVAGSIEGLEPGDVQVVYSEIDPIPATAPEARRVDGATFDALRKGYRKNLLVAGGVPTGVAAVLLFLLVRARLRASRWEEPAEEG